MTPQEKAEKLVGRFSKIENRLTYIDFKGAKQCAHIAIDEVLEVIKEDCTHKEFYQAFYEEVKQEIEKL